MRISFLGHSAVLVLGSLAAFGIISAHGGVRGEAAEDRVVFMNPQDEYTTCDDIPDGMSLLKVDVHLAADIICDFSKASAVY